MKFIKKFQSHSETLYYLSWVSRHKELPVWSCFPCNEYGDILWEKMHPNAVANILSICRGERKLRYIGIEKDTRRWNENAIIECEVCKSPVELYSHTNTCDKCHADYSLFGQRLAPRCFWGEETGETASDILMGGDMFNSNIY